MYAEHQSSAIIFQSKFSQPKIWAQVHSPTGGSTNNTSTSTCATHLQQGLDLQGPLSALSPRPLHQFWQRRHGPYMWCHQLLEHGFGIFPSLQVPAQGAGSISPGYPVPSKPQPICHGAYSVFTGLWQVWSLCFVLAISTSEKHTLISVGHDEQLHIIRLSRL